MKEPGVTLARMANCFRGLIPSAVATCDANGIPNVTLVSQVHGLDDRHVALSRQFFNKTVQNLAQNPIAAAQVYDPVNLDSYQLKLRHLRTETSGALFEQMSVRIQAIASMTGMAGIFKLIGADVFEVLSAERIEGFHGPLAGVPAVPLDGHRTELRGLQVVAQRIGAATDLAGLIDGVLEALDSYFGFRHTAAFLHDEQRGRLVALASRGYCGEGVGAEVPLGEGLFGTVANARQPLRISGLHEPGGASPSRCRAPWRWPSATRPDLYPPPLAMASLTWMNVISTGGGIDTSGTSLRTGLRCAGTRRSRAGPARRGCGRTSTASADRSAGPCRPCAARS
jgi:hypothetical protein